MLKKPINILTAMMIFVVLIIAPCALAKTLRVGVFPNANPISYQSADGSYQGIAVELWQEIARHYQWQYEFVPIHVHANQALAELQDGQLDMLVGPISVTHERLSLVNFSRPFFLNKIGLVVRDSQLSFWQTIGKIFGPTMLLLLGLFFLLLIIFGHLFWVFERGRSADIQKSYVKGIGGSFWTTITSFLRDVLYDPKSITARIILAVWLLLSVIFMAAFSAIVTATLTLVLTQYHKTYHLPSDLNNQLIAAEMGTINADIATKLGAKLMKTEGLSASVKLLQQGDVDGIVDDFFIAHVYLTQHPKLKMHMSNLVLANDSYAFALPPDSPLITDINLELTRLQDRGFATNICAKYISEHVHSCEF